MSTATTHAAARTVQLGIWELVWPSALSFTLQSMVGFVDFLIIGTLGGDAVAAAGIATQLFFIQFALFATVTAGTTAMVARAFGAGDEREADRVLRASLLLGAGLSLLCMCLIPLSESLILAFGVERGVAQLGGSYLSVALAFSLPLGLGAVFYSAQRGAGDVMTPLYVGVVVNLVNVVGDYALVLGKLGAPAMGVRGAAIASGIAMCVGLAISVALWLTGRLTLKRHGWLKGVDMDISRRLMRIGLPSAAEMAVFNFGILIFTSFMALFGTAAVSAYFIGVRILSFSFIPGVAFQVAASTLVGQNLGADNPDEAARAGWRCCLGAVAVMAGMGLTIALLAGSFTRWFDATGHETVYLAERFIWILGAAQPMMAVEFALGGALRGAGDTRFPLLSVMTGLIGGRLTLAWLAIHLLDASVVLVWCCLLADYSIKAAMLSTRFASGRWKTIAV